MPISIAALEALVAAGATAEMVVAVVNAQQAEEITRIEERRRKDRERKRNSKQSKGKRKFPRKDTENADPKVSLAANDDPQAQELEAASTTSPVNVANAVEQKEKSSPVPPPKEKSPTRVARARTREATRLPDDWQPTGDDLAFARSVLPTQLVEHEVGKFRDYWHAKPKDATKLDWSATFRTWCRRAVDGLSRGPPGNRAAQRFFAADQAKNNGGQIVENTSNASSDWRRRRDDRHTARAELHASVVADREGREGTCEGDGRPPLRVVPDA
jgi:DnaT-like ssDNA binding protein